MSIAGAAGDRVAFPMTMATRITTATTGSSDRPGATSSRSEICRKTAARCCSRSLSDSGIGHLITERTIYARIGGSKKETCRILTFMSHTRSEPPDSVNIGACGSLGVIAALEFLERHFSKLGHRDLLVTHPIRSRLQPLASTTRSVRRASGLVHTAIPDFIPVGIALARVVSVNATNK